MDVIDRINNVMLWGLRLVPIAVLCLVSFHYHKIGMSTSILGLLILCEYYALVIFKFPKYEIAEGPLVLFLFQLSIVVYGVGELNIVDFHSSFKARLAGGIFLLAYSFLSFWIAKGFIIMKKESEERELEKPICNDTLYTKEAKCLLASANEIENMQQQFLEQRLSVDNLSVPIPSLPTEENPVPFVDYLKSVSNLPSDYPALASLEQFLGTMYANQNWDNSFEVLEDSISSVTSGTGQYLVGLKDLLAETKHAVADYIHHPDSETTSRLIKNALKTFSDDVHSDFFRLSFEHAEGVGGKAAYVLRKFATDSLKGGAESFLNSEDLNNLNSNLASTFHDAFEHIVSSTPHEVDIDIFSPDFDGSAHFPFITTAIEAVRLADKWTDGDVDMVSAAEKSAVKVIGTGGGAYIGGAIGTLICPGVGSAIGAMVGGWLGRKFANNINRQELERLQAEYENQYNLLLELAEQAKRHITLAQSETTSLISNLAKEEYQVFENAKNSTPFENVCHNELLYAVDIILRDYILYFVHIQKKEGNSVTKLYSCLPSLEQIRVYPKESLELMLSVQSYIKGAYSESEYYDFELILQACVEMMIKNVVLYKTLQCTWYTEIYDSYKKSISKVLTGSDSYIKGYVETVKSEKEIIQRQKQNVDDAESRVRAEARTL